MVAAAAAAALNAIRKRSKHERAVAAREAAEVAALKAAGADTTAGWEYLISSGEIEDLPVESLRRYFDAHGLQAPESKLAMLQRIRAHHDQVRAARTPTNPLNPTFEGQGNQGSVGCSRGSHKQYPP